MPHVGGDHTKRPGIKMHGMHMTIGEFLRAAEAAKLSPDTIAELAKPPEKPNGAAAAAATDGTGYAERRLARYCTELASKADGDGRNKFLNKALHQMGRMVGAGWIERDKVERDLKQVADSIGMDQRKSAELIGRRNGPVDKGMLEPPRGRRAGGGKPSEKEILLEITEDADLFRSPDGTAFADLDVNGHRETWPIRSKTFRLLLARRYYEKTGCAFRGIVSTDFTAS
jgi:hypothetical protein